MTGFSLVEALITAVIFCLIFIAVFAIMNQGLINWHIADINIDLQQEIRRGLMVMDRHLRQSRASIISIPPDNNYYTSITFKVPEDTDQDGDVLDNLGKIEWSGNITYSLNANNQIIRADSSGTSTLANNIIGLQFRHFSGNPDVVEILITAQKETAPGKSSRINIGSLVKLRN